MSAIRLAVMYFQFLASPRRESMLRKLRSSIQKLIRQSIDQVALPAEGKSANQADAPLHLVQLEERVLYSASPMEMPAESVGEVDLDAVELDQLESADIDQAWEPFWLETEGIEGPVDDVLSTELVIIDAGVEDTDQLVEDLVSSSDRNLEIVYLDAQTDGIEQITSLLEQRSGLQAVHLVSHGSAGAIQLGSSIVDNAALAGHAGEISRWEDALVTHADILIYGCDLVANEEGQLLVQSLSELTGADVAASVDATGHESLGGDWSLEFATGVIDVSTAFSESTQASWYSVLAATANNDNFVVDADQSLNETSPGVLGNDDAEGVAPSVVSGATLNYDASLDTDGNGTWEDSTGISGFDWSIFGTLDRNGSLANVSTWDYSCLCF